MALIISLFITYLFCFIVCELVAARLPKTWHPYLILRVGLLLFIGCQLLIMRGAFKTKVPETVASLMEQVRGDKLHWNSHGGIATTWEEGNHRHYKESCQKYAIERLGELGPSASEAVPELVDCFNAQGDYNTGDGVVCFRSTIAKTLGAIGQPEAINPMVEMLLQKSISPEDSSRGNIHWHDEEYEGFRSYLKQGTGPQAIMMGLMEMPSKYHDSILEKLEIVRAEIELSDEFNAWSKFEIDRGIRFLAAGKKTKKRFRDRGVLSGWYLDDTEFENLMDPNYQRPPIKFTRLSNE